MENKSKKTIYVALKDGKTTLPEPIPMTTLNQTVRNINTSKDHSYQKFKADMENAFNEDKGIKITPLNFTEKKSCTKVKFATEADALYYINKLKSTSSREKKPIDTYLCHFCSCWHLTSRPNYDTKDKNTIKALKTELKNKNQLIAQLNLKINQLKKGKN